MLSWTLLRRVTDCPHLQRELHFYRHFNFGNYIHTHHLYLYHFNMVNAALDEWCKKEAARIIAEKQETANSEEQLKKPVGRQLG